MTTAIRTNANNAGFINLVKQLDAYLADVDGKEHAFYNKLNYIDSLQHVIVVYEDGKPVGCGAMRQILPDAMEVKRMYTTPGNRGKGIAKAVLTELETWAKEEGFKICRLETGKRMPEAIALYRKCGYKNIANYGKYMGVANSVCFEKEL